MKISITRSSAVLILSTLAIFVSTDTCSAVPVQTEFDGTDYWQLVFRQKDGVYANKTDAESFNVSDPSNDFYSVLTTLEDLRDDEGKFTFRLEWTRLSDNQPLSSQVWSQTSNPLTSPGEFVSGYTPITIPYDVQSWAGLALGTNVAALIDGSIGTTNWYFNVGSVNPFGGGQPGPSITVSSTELWVAFVPPVVPEPSTALMCLIALPIGQMVRRRRRQRSAA